MRSLLGANQLACNLFVLQSEILVRLSNICVFVTNSTVLYLVVFVDFFHFLKRATNLLKFQLV